MAEGLDKALQLAPRSGYVEAQAGWSSLSGAYARGEAGANLGRGLGAFVFAEANQRERMAGAGMRWEFEL